MGIGSDPVNTLLIASLLLIVGAVALDELGRYLTPVVRHYRARLIPGRVTWRTFLPLIMAMVLVVLMWRAVLVSIYLIAVGILITLYFLQRTKKEQQLLPARQIFQLVLAFRSTFQLQPSIFLTLDTVKEKLEEPLRGLMKVVVQTYYLTSSPERAFAELRARTDNVYLNQFAYILEMSETARADAVVKALDNLVERLRTHDELRREAESNLTAITGQTSFIQGISVLIILVVAAVPRLRAPYVPVGGQIFLVIVLTVMLAASYYIDRVISKLAERIS